MGVLVVKPWGYLSSYPHVVFLHALCYFMFCFGFRGGYMGY